ncbi:MAG: hypothetical protein PWQ33_1300 [Pseudothermotoga sp.]|nr:MAG: Uncharacterized protein XD56_1905 [Pseudothermotoga lettingae]MDK2884721.1 hypothetical protein [Pseudothermotoga sp.]
MDSNHRPPGYEPGALPVELRAHNHCSLYIQPLKVSRAFRMVIALETNVMKLDPVRKLLKRYPRIVVIKAALMVLKSGQKVDAKSIEEAISVIMKAEKSRE